MSRPLRVARVISRLNVGGPARHVLLASAGLAPDHETLLLVGDVASGETEASAWIAESGVRPERVPGLGRPVRPLDDRRAASWLESRFRAWRPDVVHTHTAKAGTLGRVAARRAGVPHVVHTFHGHVFEGYFGRFLSGLIVAHERRLARRTDRIVAVSAEVADDLVVRHRVAPREKVVVVPVGIDLRPFTSVDAGRRAAARAALGIGHGEFVAVLAGRLVTVKEPQTAVEAWRSVRAAHPAATLLVAGDGPMREAVQRGAGPGVRFLGWRFDMPDVWAAADVALLTSRNEGTPVALVEAAAAGVPAVATRVGGVPSVVADGETGVLVPPGDPAAVCDAVLSLSCDPDRCARLGAAARARAAERFGAARLLADLRALYAGLAGAPR